MLCKAEGCWKYQLCEDLLIVWISFSTISNMNNVVSFNTVVTENPGHGMQNV